MAIPDGENMLSRGRGERGHVDSSNAFGLNPVCREVMRGKGRQEGELCMVFSSAAFHIKVIHMF